MLVSATGLISIAGGKYTTYRIMARDAVDAAAADLGVKCPIRTDEIALVGARGWAELMEDPSRIGLPDPVRLLGRYGSEVGSLAALVESDPSMGMPLVDDLPYLRAEIAIAALEEGALHLDESSPAHQDLDRDQRSGLQAAEEAIRIIGPILGWDAAATTRRSIIIGPAWLLNVNRKASPTTTPPTPPAWVPPT